MDQLLTALAAALSGLGPAGPLIGAAVVGLAWWLRQRFGPAAPPVMPTPIPSPATSPLRLDAEFPLLNRLLTALGIAPKGRPATSADVTHETLVQLRAEVDALTEAKAASHAAALADLRPEPTDQE